MARIILRPLFFMLAFLLPVAAASQERVLSLTTFGKSSSREAAINSAQKEAIQQSLSIFDSSTSRLLSDIIIQEGSAPSGIIKSSEVFSSATLPDSSSVVSLIAKISLDSLFTCAKTHEPDVQLPNEYVLKIKLREVKKKNEEIALMQVRKQVEALAQNMFRFEIVPDNYPKLDTICGEIGCVFLNDIRIIANQTSHYIHNLILSVLKSTSLSEAECNEYSMANIPYSSFTLSSNEWGLTTYHSRLSSKDLGLSFIVPLMNVMNDAFFAVSIQTLDPLQIEYTVDNLPSPVGIDCDKCFFYHVNSAYSGFDSYSRFRHHRIDDLTFAISAPSIFTSLVNKSYKDRPIKEPRIPFFSRFVNYAPITTIQAAVFIKEKDLAQFNGFRIHRAPKRPQMKAVDLGVIITNPDGSSYSLCWAECNLNTSAPEDLGGKYKWGEVVPCNADNYQLGRDMYKQPRVFFDYYYGWLREDLGWKECEWPNKLYRYEFEDRSDLPTSVYSPLQRYCKKDRRTNFSDYYYIDDAARVALGGGWRIPTKLEWEALISQCTWERTMQNGVRGYLVTSKKNHNSIFLPMSLLDRPAWALETFGKNNDGNYDAFYLSSSIDSDYVDDYEDAVCTLYILGDTFILDGFSADYGFSTQPRVKGCYVRPVIAKALPNNR